MTADLNRAAGDALRVLAEAGVIRGAWLPGMLGTDSIRVAALCASGPVGTRFDAPTLDADGAAEVWWDHVASDADPDTDDPLTVAGLLLLAEEAGVIIERSYTDNSYGHWSDDYFAYRVPVKTGPSESMDIWGDKLADVVVAALVARVREVSDAP